MQARSQGGGGGSGGSYDPPQLPIPKILFHPLAILFHPLAILFHLSAILFHPLAILFHPSAILFHPWNMWMTSHGQCPRGGACECPRVGAFFKLMTSRGQCPRGGGCAWCPTHRSSDPPPTWLAGYGPGVLDSLQLQSKWTELRIANVALATSMGTTVSTRHLVVQIIPTILELFSITLNRVDWTMQSYFINTVLNIQPL